MSMKKVLAGVVGIAAMSSLLIYGCSSSDSPAGPGGGNPGGGTGTKISKGVYDITFQQWTCGAMDTMTQAFTQVQCVDFSFDELFELDCPVTITNNSFTVNCTQTVNDGFCSYTEQIQATGSLSGTTWTVTGTSMISNENPAGCSGQPACSEVRAVIQASSTGLPTACTYAPINTVDATVTGGPFAGGTEFQAAGFVTNNGGLLSWSINAAAGTFAAAKRDEDRIQNVAGFNLNLVDIDPNSLPATFGITVIGGGKATALPSGTASYYDQTTSGTYFFSTGGSGTVTVNEVTETYVAGTIGSLNISGMEYIEGGGTTPASRTISGGFFVQAFTSTKPEITRTQFGRALLHGIGTE